VWEDVRLIYSERESGIVCFCSVTWRTDWRWCCCTALIESWFGCVIDQRGDTKGVVIERICGVSITLGETTSFCSILVSIAAGQAQMVPNSIITPVPAARTG